MNTLPFFKFTTAAWRTGKISFCTPEEKGIFASLLPLIWDAGGEYEIDKFTPRYLNTTEQVFSVVLQTLVESGLVIRNGNVLSVKFLTEQLEEYERLCKKRAAAGRKSGAARRTKRTSVEQNRTNKNKIKNKNKKEDKEEDKGAAPLVPPTPPDVPEESKPRVNICPASFRDFVDYKTMGQFKHNLNRWRAVWGQLISNSSADDVEDVILWAAENYLGAIAAPQFFVSDTWPKILAGYRKKDELQF